MWLMIYEIICFLIGDFFIWGMVVVWVIVFRDYGGGRL